MRGRIVHIPLRALMALIVAFVLAPALAAQSTEEPATSDGSLPAVEALDVESGETAEGEVVPQEAAALQNDLNFIDELLTGDELEDDIASFSYDDGGRRDPFRSLLNITDEVSGLGPRPDGIPGFLIDELTVTGVFVLPEGPVAQVQTASESKNYLLHVGDRLFDGDVVRISMDRENGAQVVFKQVVNDRTAAKPFREVVRRLSP